MYGLDTTTRDQERAAEALDRDGWLPISCEPFFRGGLGLLRNYLSHVTPPSRDADHRVDAFAHRERPYRPEEARFWTGRTGTTQHPETESASVGLSLAAFSSRKAEPSR